MGSSASPPEPGAKILLVDDHPVFLEGVRSLLSHLEGYTICAETDGEAEAMDLLAAEPPDLMIVDLRLQRGSGMKLIRRARQAYPNLRILVASMYEEALYGERAVLAGANGYFCKQDDPDLLLKAIALVHRGEMFVSRKLANRLLVNNSSAKTSRAGEPEDVLSDRELQVFNLLGGGASVREIASQLHLSSKTIDAHRDHIKRKLGIDSNARLIRRAVEWVLSR